MSLADELRDIATNVAATKSVPGVSSVAEAFRNRAKLAAHKGEFSFHIWRIDVGYSIESCEAAAIELRDEGFTVEVGNEIIAWYSNTDWDTEDFIKVSWK